MKKSYTLTKEDLEYAKQWIASHNRTIFINSFGQALLLPLVYKKHWSWNRDEEIPKAAWALMKLLRPTKTNVFLFKNEKQLIHGIAKMLWLLKQGYSL